MNKDHNSKKSGSPTLDGPDKIMMKGEINYNKL